MKKNQIIHYLTIILGLSLVPALYFFWENYGESTLINSVRQHPAVNVTPVGKPAVDFGVPKTQVWARQDFRLSSLGGHPIFLHFWATWCGPCLVELPEIIQLAKKLRPLGYSFVAVAIDESWAKVETFFLQNPELKEMTDLMVLVLDPEAKVAQSYGSSRFPETFLINGQMVVDNKFVGAQPWNSPGMEPYWKALKVAPQP